MRAAALLVLLALASPPAQEQAAGPPGGNGRISGRVLAPSGAPIAGADVWVAYFEPGPRVTEFRFTARTEPDGTYVLQRLPAGRFRVMAEKPGYSNMSTQPGQLGAGVLVDLDEHGAANGIDLVLRATGRIAGRVLRPDGTPVSQARVGVQVRQPNGRILGVQAPSVTGSDGAYRLDNVPQGSYVVMASYSVRHEMIGKPEPREYNDWARTFHHSTTDFDAAARLDVLGGDAHEGIDVILRPDPRFSVSGVVVDAQNRPPRSARVEYGTATSWGSGDGPGEPGRFDIRGVANGLLHLLARAEDEGGPLIGYAAVEIMGGSISDVRVVVARPARVSGRLVAEAAAPPAGLRVVLAPIWFRPHEDGIERDSAAVDSAGAFAIDGLIGDREVRVAGLPAGWAVEVRRAGHALPEPRLTLAAGQVVDDLEVVIVPRN